MKKNRIIKGLLAVLTFVFTGCITPPQEISTEAEDDGEHWYTWLEEDFLQTGDRYLSQENYEGAAYWYERGLKDNPNSDELDERLQQAGVEKPVTRQPDNDDQQMVQLVERIPGYTIFIEVSFGLHQRNDEPPFRTSKIRGVFPGVANVFILREDGALWGAGYNHSSQLGINEAPRSLLDEDTVEKDLITRISGNSSESGFTIKSIAAGENHTIILMDDGTLWGAGESLYGEFGLGDNGAIKLEGLTPLSIDNVRDIAVGNNSTFVIRNDGTFWAAGYNYYGELGLGDRNNRMVFTRVASAGRDVRAVSAGARHTVLLKNDGSVWASGYNFNGQLGLGHIYDSENFTQVSSLGRNARAIATGSSHSVVLFNDGTVWTAGENFYNQLGWDDSTDHNRFTQVQDNNGQYIRDAKEIAARGNQTLILTGEGSLLLSGSYADPRPRNEDDLPPENTVVNQRPASSFVSLEVENDAVLDDIDRIVLGNQSIYVITENDKLLVAGSNRFGQLGLSLDTEVSPVLKPLNP